LGSASYIFWQHIPYFPLCLHPLFIDKKWNADADKHILSASGSGGSADGGFTTTHTIPKDAQAQAKMYVPKENDK